MEVRLCESTPEAICGQILAEENILEYVRGCWVIPFQPGGAIFLGQPKTSPVIVKLLLLFFKMSKNWSK